MKRLLLRLGLVAVVLLAGAGGFKLLKKVSFFSVKRVELVGARYLTPATIAHALAIPKGTSIFDATGPLQRRAAQVTGV
ncbi:MAG TPA: hypothetical protein VFU23_04365, partial [Gemmatimonadales bacterium]|nr:hypothetical protein [Gemmatimonadales bacterium]